MKKTPSFDFRSRAEQARKAQLDFKNHTAELLQKLRETRNPETFSEWCEFQKSPTYQRLLAQFWAALEAAYPPDFDADFDKLRSHSDMKALETAVAFLEADPYFFRTGYIKEKLLRYIRGYELTPPYVSRLQQALLSVVDRHYCREFGEYCRLTRKIGSRTLRQELGNRATNHEDPNVRKRAQWVLDWIEANLPADYPDQERFCGVARGSIA